MNILKHKKSARVLRFVQHLAAQRDAEYQRAETYRELAAQLAQERDAEHLLAETYRELTSQLTH